jgi:hypothetical protein
MVTNTLGVQLFRKEAIFRRMKHYSREHERSQVQIAELEQRKNTCEAGMVAMAACWEQVFTLFVSPNSPLILFFISWLPLFELWQDLKTYRLQTQIRRVCHLVLGLMSY